MEIPTVGEIMTQPAIAIDPDLGVDDALELMGANSCRRLPVVSETGRVIGIITLAAAQKAKAEAGSLRGTLGGNVEHAPKVRDVMTDYVYTVDPGISVSLAAKMMVNHHVGALPVVEEHKLVGILTESDIFRYVAGQLDDEAAAAGGGGGGGAFA